MKQQLLILTTLLLPINLFAQTNSVEKNIWGVQVGIYPLSFYNEVKLSNNIALRSELWMGFGWSGNGYNYNSSYWEILPYIQVEPRWYYNLERRASKAKQTKVNSGNYLSLQIGSQPGFGKTSDNVTLHPSVYIAPMYGLRREIGKNFNFETGLGYLYGWQFETYSSLNGITQHNTTTISSLNFRLSIGYNF